MGDMLDVGNLSAFDATLRNTPLAFAGFVEIDANSVSYRPMIAVHRLEFSCARKLMNPGNDKAAWANEEI